MNTPLRPAIGRTGITWSGFGLLSMVTSMLAPGLARAQQPIPIAEIQRDTPVSFEREIVPILRRSCLACHSASEAYGGLVLESAPTIREGGDSGAAVVPGKPAESLLLKVASFREEPLMPPPDNDVQAKPLTSQELGLLRLWIDQGAEGAASAGLSPRDWRPLPPGEHPIYAVAVTPDGQFAACGRANQVFIYHVPTGQLVTKLTDPDLLARFDDPRPGVAHLDVVQSLAFNREGDLLATGGFRTVKLWRRPHDVQRLAWTSRGKNESAASGGPAEPAPVGVAAVSPDRTRFATGGVDGLVRLYGAADGEISLELAGHTGPVTGLAFLPQGSRLCSSSEDGTVRIWDLQTGELAARLDARRPIVALAVLAQGRQLATASPENVIQLWQMPPDWTTPLAVGPESRLLATDPARELVAAANREGAVRVLDASSGRIVAQHDHSRSALRAVALGRERKLLIGCEDGTVLRHSLTEDRTLDLLHAGLTPVVALAAGPDDESLASGSADGHVSLWHMEPPPPTVLARDNGAAATAMALSADGALLATAGVAFGQPAIFIRETATGNVVRLLLGHAAPVTALAFSSDNRRLVSGSLDATARVWDLARGKFPEQARFDGHTAAVTSVAFRADAGAVLSASEDHSAVVWSAADGSVMRELAGHAGAVVGVAVTAEDKYYVTASADKSIRVWTGEATDPVATIATEAALVALAVAADGSLLAAADDEGAVTLYTLADGKEAATLKGHTAAIRSLQFSATGGRLLSCDGEAALVWSVPSGRLLEKLPSEQGLAAAIFSADPSALLMAERCEESDTVAPISLRPLRFRRALGAGGAAVRRLAYHPGGQVVYAGFADGAIRSFTVADGNMGFEADHGGELHDLALSPDASLLASAGEGPAVKVWNAANGQPAAQPLLEGFAGSVASVVFSADGSRLIGGGSQAGDVLVFHTASGRLEHAFGEHAQGLVSLAAGNGEADLVFSASSGSVRAWPLLAGRRLAGHSEPVSSLAAVPGEAVQLISGSLDGTVRQWNAATGEQVRQMAHGGPVTAVAASPDAARFASTGENNAVRLWNAENGQQVAEMQGDIRSRNRIRTLEQALSIAQSKGERAAAAVKVAEEAIPVRMAAAQQAATALAAADKAVADAKAAYDKVEAVKLAAEKTAIEASAASQKAASIKAGADQQVALNQAALRRATGRAERARAAAEANPDDEKLADGAKAAASAMADAEAQLKKATAAAEAATAAAEAAAKSAAAAAAAAVAAAKPAAEARTALLAAEAEQVTAARNVARTAAELKEAQELVPATQRDVASVEEEVERVTVDLEAATKAAEGAVQPIRCVAFSPDGRTLATGGDFAVMHTWNADDGAAIESFAGHTGTIATVAYLSEDEVLSAGEDAGAVVWSVNPGWQLERTIGSIDDPTTLVNRVAALDFNPDGTLLAAVGGEPSRSGELKVFQVADGSMVLSVPDAHADSIYDLQFSPDGRFLATAAGDRTAKRFRVADGVLMQKYEGHTDHVLGVSFQGDGRVLATCGADHTVKIWDAEAGTQIRTIAGFNKHVTAIRFIGQTGTTVASAGDPVVRQHNSGNGQVVRNFPGTADYMYAVAATPDGRFVVAGGYDGVLRVWNGGNGQVVQSLAAPQPEMEDQDED